MAKTLEKIFSLKTSGTTLKTELIAGLTTFSTLSYVIFVVPGLLTKTGMDFESVLIATCLAAAIGTILTAFLANYPFAQAPGMGLTAYFVYTVVLQNGYSWQAALFLVFCSGVIFVLLTATGLRSKLAEGLPDCVLKAIPVGIGLFITLIGMNNAGLVEINQGPIIDILLGASGREPAHLINDVLNAPPQIVQMGSLSNPEVLLAILGLLIMGILVVKRVTGAILIGILTITAIHLICGLGTFPETIFTERLNLSPTFLQLNPGGLFEADKTVFSNILNVITIVIAFTIVDLFDTVGTLYGTADKGGFLTKDGKLPKLNRALMADAIATTFGALLGTSTTTTYIESGSGIAAGGRTGLSSVVVALLFLCFIFISPLASIIPPSATSPALIMVGVFMMGSIKKIDFEQWHLAIPAFLTIVVIPFTYSIANGIGAGIIFYLLLSIFNGGIKKVKPIVFVIAALFMVKFITG
ncbi:MAG: NCS2 family permease [Croceivirga sp.]